MAAFIFPSSILAQTDTIFLKFESEKSLKENATLYRVVTKKNDHYLVKDFNIEDDRLQMIANCDSIEPLVKTGHAIYYYENRQKKSEGNYVKNAREGIWTIWDETGTDSAVVQCFKGGNYKNIYIAPNHLSANNKLDELYPIDIPASFPGGERKMQEFLAKRIEFPRLEVQNGINGKCYVTFIIEEDGSLTNIELLDRGVLNTIGYNKEALRITKLMPKWQPAMEFGQPTITRFYLPIKFTVTNEKPEWEIIH